MIERRDPKTAEVIETAEATLGALAVGPSGLWHIDTETRDAGDDDTTVTQLHPESLETLDTFTFDAGQPDSQDVVVTEDYVWILAERQRLVVLDAGSGDVSEVELPSRGSALVADGEGVWVAHPDERVIRHVEGSEIARTIDVPAGLDLLALTDDGTLWLAGGDRIIPIDPART